MPSDRVIEILSVWVVLTWAGPASAATVTFDIVPTGAHAAGATEVVVAPGQEVPYEITASVTSDDTTAQDNNGLAFFTLTLETDLGVAQMAADKFDADIAQAFTLLAGLGTPSDDDLLEIGGGQNTFLPGAATTGVAVGQTQVLVRGRLTTPQTEDTFTISLAGSANAFDPGSDTSVSPATVSIGPGFTIRTEEGADADSTPPPTVSVCGCGTCGMLACSLLMLTLAGRAPRRRR